MLGVVVFLRRLLSVGIGKMCCYLGLYVGFGFRIRCILVMAEVVFGLNVDGRVLRVGVSVFFWGSEVGFFFLVYLLFIFICLSLFIK